VKAKETAPATGQPATGGGRIVLHNARLLTPFRSIPRGGVVAEEGRIREVFSGQPPALGQVGLRIDLQGSYLAPGFVEVHTHGAGGHDFMDGTPEAVLAACRTHLRHGTTSIYPSTLTSSEEELASRLENIRSAMGVREGMPDILGVHLEGPYLSPEQAGAQDPRYVRNPDRREYLGLLDRFGFIRRWTVAPELPGALEMGRELARRGIVASIGHSNAVYEQVLAACQNGYSLVTHLFNGMSRLTRRNAYMYPGVAESALAIDGLDVEVIADGKHLPPSLLKLIYKVKGPEAICLCTDSMRAAGQEVSESIIGGREGGLRVVIEDGVAFMPDRASFAGSIATADRLVRTMVRLAGVPLGEAVRMMSHTPARIMGVDGQKGSIAAGKDADLVAFDDEIEVSLVMVRGLLAWRSAGV
jgi:N-acetylglucosamine-6-phosphate deacetylase